MFFVPESYFLPAAGVEYLWASPASQRSAACPDSPGTSPLPPCTPYTPAFDASWPQISQSPALALRRPSPQPWNDGLCGAQLNGRAAGGGGWQRDAWWWRRTRSTSENCCQMVSVTGRRRPVTAVEEKERIFINWYVYTSYSSQCKWVNCC